MRSTRKEPARPRQVLDMIRGDVYHAFEEMKHTARMTLTCPARPDGSEAPA